MRVGIRCAEEVGVEKDYVIVPICVCVLIAILADNVNRNQACLHALSSHLDTGRCGIALSDFYFRSNGHVRAAEQTGREHSTSYHDVKMRCLVLSFHRSQAIAAGRKY